jgi:hypothetical protein
MNNENIVLQEDGLAMGAPTTSIISELFLQYLEQTNLPHIAQRLKLVNYFRYVDDLLIIFDSQHTDINTNVNEFNALHPKIQFREEAEEHNKINYLDITIHRKHTHVKISVFRKPTYTDTLIPYISNHPTQHEHAAIRFLYNRLNSYQLLREEYQYEENLIHNILHNNGFPIWRQKRKQKHSQNQNTQPPNSKKWCTFTYIGKETSFITKIFKHANLQITYRTSNTLQKHLSYSNTQQDKFTKSGVYKLTCPDCDKAYIGQTGRNLYTRYDEHKRAYRYNTLRPKFAKHLIEHGHSFQDIESTMEVLHFHKKGTHLNTIDRFYIHKEAINNNHLNEEYVETTNQIFSTISERFK